jgi:2-methylcitrate dehydratase PrpD
MDGMGIAYSQCSCSRQGSISGALVIRVQQGLAARGGITAVMLAQRGITGARDVLEGTYGLYPLYARNEYEPARITDGLGKRFELIQTTLKPYPCCGRSYSPVAATLQIVKEHNIEPEEIEEIAVMTHTHAYLGNACGDNKYRPQNTVDAQFSIPYAVAVAAVQRRVSLADFTEEAIKNSQVLEMCRRVKVSIDPEIDKLPGTNPAARIELKTKNGRLYPGYVEFIKGHPRNPLTWEECIEKFKACAPLSVKPLTENAIAQIINKVDHLEDVKDVREFIRLLK